MKIKCLDLLCFSYLLALNNISPPPPPPQKKNQFVIGIFFIFRLLPESLPWLISQKRWTESLSTIKKIAQINGKEAENVSSMLPSSCHNENVVTEEVPLQSSADATELSEMISNDVASAASADHRHSVHKRLMESDVDSHTNFHNNISEQNTNGTCKTVSGIKRGSTNGRINGTAVSATSPDHVVPEASSSSAFLDLFQNKRMRLYSFSMFFLL
jgi:hypothetical protein